MTKSRYLTVFSPFIINTCDHLVTSLQVQHFYHYTVLILLQTLYQNTSVVIYCEILIKKVDFIQNTSLRRNINWVSVFFMS